MTIEIPTHAPHNPKSISLTDTHSHRTVLGIYASGGTGCVAVQGIKARLGARDALSYGFIDTRIPPGVPTHQAITLNPDALPHKVTPTIAKHLPLLGIDARTYEQFVPAVSVDGLSQLPALGLLTALLNFDVMKKQLRRDFDEAAHSCHGASRSVLLTFASSAGGTGTPAARVLGLAARSVLPSNLLWIHVLVATTLLPEEARSRRNHALEHQQLREFAALMREGATLKLPDVHAPITKPGPNHLLILTSSIDAPRTLDETLDELASVITNFLR